MLLLHGAEAVARTGATETVAAAVYVESSKSGSPLSCVGKLTRKINNPGHERKSVIRELSTLQNSSPRYTRPAVLRRPSRCDR